jgi:hypothetical protein
MNSLNGLAAILEDEVRLGEQLLQNLDAQKSAVLAWDAAALIACLEEMEVLAGRLDSAEKNRRDIMASVLYSEANLSLGELLARIPPGPLRSKLSSLRREAREVYGRLAREEKSLLVLVRSLAGHLRQAFDGLFHPPANLYGECGALAPPVRESKLVEAKI